LLADEGHKVCDLYGVWGPKKLMGREYEGVLRTTFLIDAAGNIVKVFEKVRPAEHSEEVLSALAMTR
jgi:peroxiredoxin Q/BCP